MAPKFILSKSHDIISYWWSVGILLYEMVTWSVDVDCVKIVFKI